MDYDIHDLHKTQRLISNWGKLDETQDLVTNLTNCLEDAKSDNDVELVAELSRDIFLIDILTQG